MAHKVDPSVKRQVVRIQDYQRVFSSEDGKKVLRDLIKSFQMLDSTFDPSDGGIKMAYLEGQRSVVLHILGRLNTDADELQRLITEAIHDGNITKLSGI